MTFEWDEQKNQSNIEKHGLDFNDAPDVFKGGLIVSRDDREDYGEPRFSALGMLKDRVVSVVFTVREPDTVRVISLRKANRREIRQYEQEIKD
jgi:uncharacterized protein